MRWTFDTRVDPSLSGDKIKMPPSALHFLMNEGNGGHQLRQQQHQQPWTFKLTATSQPRSIYAAVREFTAPDERTCFVSPFIYKHLFGDTEDGDAQSLSIDVENVYLPRGTFAELVARHPPPTASSSSDDVDMRSLLESELRRKFTTLTRGVEIAFPAVRMAFEVKTVRGDGDAASLDGVLVIDTDLSVDLQYPATATHVGLQQAKDEIATIDHDIEVKLSRRSTTFQLDARYVHRLAFEVLLPSGDVDVYASLTTSSPNAVDGCDFWNIEKGERSGIFDFQSVKRPENAPGVENRVVLVVLSAFGGDPVNGTIRFKVNPPPSPQNDADNSTSAPPADTRQCANCHAWISVASYPRHEAFCARNNKYCTQCKRVFPVAEWPQHWHCEQCSYAGNMSTREKHEHYMHRLTRCVCSIEMFWNDYQHHRRVECPERLIRCRYCHTNVPAGVNSTRAEDIISSLQGTPITDHESECGSRTIECQVCKRKVTIKTVQSHMAIHTHERRLRATQLPFRCCSNAICSRPRDTKNDMGLCMLCFGPFWMANVESAATSASDVEGPRKRIERLIRKYFDQLTQGCGRPTTCLNPYCASSQKKAADIQSPLDANGAAMKALELVRQSSLRVPGINDNPPTTAQYYYLCMTDTKSMTKRALANEKLIQLGYPLEWCLEALNKSERAQKSVATNEETNDDDSDDDMEEVRSRHEQKWIQRAVTWLVSNAPTQTE